MYLHGNDVARAPLPSHVDPAEFSLTQAPADLEVVQGPSSGLLTTAAASTSGLAAAAAPCTAGRRLSQD